MDKNTMRPTKKAASFSENCPSFETLNAYARMQLTEEEDIKVERSLEKCSQKNCICNDLLQGLEMMLETERMDEKKKANSTDAQIPKKEEAGVFALFTKRYVGIAATIGLLVVSSLLIFINYSPNQKGNLVSEKSLEITSDNPASQEEPSLGQIAQLGPDFALHDDLEAALMKSLRGEETSKVKKIIKEDQVQFLWTIETEGKKEIIIRTNQNEIQFQQVLSEGEKTVTIPTSSWKQGLYYYELNDYTLGAEASYRGRLALIKK